MKVMSIWAVSALCVTTVVLTGGVNVTSSGKVKTCTVMANGNHQDGVPNIAKAQTCGQNGIVVLPKDQTYWIATKLDPILSNVLIMERAMAGMG